MLNRLAPVLGLALVFGLFAILGPKSFSSARNLETIARQTAIVGTAALGMTLIIIAGGIDLSVGSIVALSTVVIALLLQAGASPWLAALGGVAAGAVCGLVNDLLVTRLRVVPFIVTLGTLLVLRGAAKGLARESGCSQMGLPNWVQEIVTGGIIVLAVALDRLRHRRQAD